MRSSPAANTLLDEAQIADVRARSDLWAAWLVVHAWVVILAAMVMFVSFPNIVTFVLAVMLIGSRQLGLLVLMHDAAHGVLFKSRRLNAMVAQCACAWPTFADVRVYRRYHLPHHVHTQQASDPDLILTGHYPIARASLRRKLSRDLSGQTGFSQRKAQWLDALGANTWPLRRRVMHFWSGLGPQLCSNLFLLGLAAVSGYAWIYFALWLLPLLTWHQVVLRIRNIAEHAVVRAAEDAFGNARTTIANPLERVFIAPYWVNYHLEHHLMMWVPCYRLPLLRQYLFAAGYGERIETEHGYRAVLRKATANTVDKTDAGQRRRASGTFGSGFEAT